MKIKNHTVVLSAHFDALLALALMKVSLIYVRISQTNTRLLCISMEYSMSISSIKYL